MRDIAGLYRLWQQTQDPEQKIELGERILALEPGVASWPLSEPRERIKGELWFTVGSLYAGRARGVRADNVKSAIKLLEAALSVSSRDAAPDDWATIHNNLGIGYWGRIRGEQADNQESALAHFETAAEIFTRETHRQQWGQLQNNIGIVYWNRIRGERPANLEAAITHFQGALGVFTRDSEPVLWASVQNNLGSAFRARTEGERDANREEAITHLEAALMVFTRETFPNEWAQAQNNLAVAYLDRRRGEQADNQDRAIEHIQAALSVFSRETAPQLWATTQRSAGNAFAGRIRGDKASNRKAAIAAYEAALTVFTRDASPLEHLRTSRALGHQLLDEGSWKRAVPVYTSAREAFLLLFGQGLEAAESHVLVTEAGPLFAEAAFLAVQMGANETALQVASEGRARLLSVALKLQTLQLPPEKRQQLDELRTAIHTGEQAVETAQGAARGEALEKLVGWRKQLLDLIAGSGGDAGSLGSALEEAREIANANTVIAMPVVTHFGGKILLIGGGRSKAVSVVDLPDLTTERISAVLVGAEEGKTAGWIASYFIHYFDPDETKRRWPEWLDAVDKLGPQLWALLGGQLDKALKAQGVKRGTRLVWMPPGWLGILPLGLAQDPASKRRLADDYEIVYAPSLDALAGAQRRIAKTAPATLAAVINPTGDLPGSEKEGAIVASHFSDGARTLLEREDATPEAVLAALKGKTYWHFASHGTFSWQDARQSALLMHGAVRLSVGQLLESEGLGQPRLVVLSACETGLSEISKSPDEFIGLPGTFTALGAAGVLGTLWPVSDAATALLMSKFYELHIDAKLSPPAALSGAQKWLRDASDEDLDAYAKLAATRGRIESRHLAEIEKAVGPDSTEATRMGVGSLAKMQKGGEGKPAARRPYAHPYYWGGFIYTGL